MPYAKPPTEIVYRPIEQRNPIRGLVPIRDALVRLGMRQLIAARVGGHHTVEVSSERDRHLTVPRAGIPRQRATGDHRGQPGEELIGVARPIPRIRVGVAGIVILEHDCAGNRTNAIIDSCWPI